jgi:hypothetical protein
MPGSWPGLLVYACLATCGWSRAVSGDNAFFASCGRERRPYPAQTTPQGAYAGPLFGGMPTERIHCNDSLPAAEVRYMESFETRHSNHGLASQIGGEPATCCCWCGGLVVASGLAWWCPRAARAAALERARLPAVAR